MTRQPVVRPLAEIDRASHFLYLSQRSPDAALRFDHAVSEVFTRLTRDSQLGTRLPIPQASERDLRFCRPKGFKSYLIVHRNVGDAVYVTRVLHSSQDIEMAVLDG